MDREAVFHDLDIYDLSRFCGMVPGVSSPLPELTEDGLQALEEKADNWYMGIAGVL